MSDDFTGPLPEALGRAVRLYQLAADDRDRWKARAETAEAERDAAMRNWTDVQDAWQPIVEAAAKLVARWLHTRHSFTAEEQALIDLIGEPE